MPKLAVLLGYLYPEREICSVYYLWDVVVPSFSLLFLQLDRDTTDWSSLDTLHQMGHKPRDLQIENVNKNTINHQNSMHWDK